MAVYKRERSKFYWTKFTLRGEKVQVSTKCTSKAKALDFESSLRHQMNLGAIGVDALRVRKNATTFAEAFELFIAGIDGQVKESTIKSYQTKAVTPLAVLGSKYIDKIDRATIDAYITRRRSDRTKAPVRLLKVNKKAKGKKTVSPATVNRELTLVGMVLNYVKPGSWQAITQPARSRRLKRLKEDNERSELIVLSPVDEKKYLFACHQPLADVAAIMLDCGLRPEEVLRLQKHHADLSTGFISIPFGKTKAAKRKVRISERVRFTLAKRIKQSPSSFLFPGGKKYNKAEPMAGSSLYRSHRDAVKASGITKAFRIYDCRHTFATRFVESGGDLVTLAAILGHSDIKMVMRYAHPTEQHQADAIERMEQHQKAANLHVAGVAKM